MGSWICKKKKKRETEFWCFSTGRTGQRDSFRGHGQAQQVWLQAVGIWKRVVGFLVYVVTCVCVCNSALSCVYSQLWKGKEGWTRKRGDVGQPVRNELKVPNPFLHFQFVLHAIIEYFNLCLLWLHFIWLFLWSIQWYLDGFTSLTVRRKRALFLSLSLCTQNWGSSGFAGSYIYVSHCVTPCLHCRGQWPADNSQFHCYFFLQTSLHTTRKTIKVYFSVC